MQLNRRRDNTLSSPLWINQENGTVRTKWVSDMEGDYETEFHWRVLTGTDFVDNARFSNTLNEMKIWSKISQFTTQFELHRLRSLWKILVHPNEKNKWLRTEMGGNSSLRNFIAKISYNTWNLPMRTCARKTRVNPECHQLLICDELIKLPLFYADLLRHPK